jgi:hypothetical protein
MNNARSPAPNVGFLNNVANNVANVGNAAVNMANGAAEAIANTANVVANNVANVITNNVPKNNGLMNVAANVFKANNTIQGTSLLGFSWTQIFLMAVLFTIFVLIAVFYNEIIGYLDNLFRPSALVPDKPETNVPPMSVEESKDEADAHKSAVERILPGRKEVFNVSQNKYSYYDAQALCKSLGSELATYDQVKEAYDQGADWCNYGWVDGQMAVYPTQEKSWAKLQEGPEDARTSCGRPGVNGGYFDNPELQFGVSCYGIKPAQSKHDASAIAAGQSAPLSPEGIALEKKVAGYRGAHVPIMPFSESKWAQ